VVLETTRSGGTFTCSGVALNPKTVLTAAHCAAGAASIRVSPDFLYDANSPNFVPVQMDRVRIHPKYVPSKSLYSNDLAVLALAVPLPQSLNYVPIPYDHSVPVQGDWLERIGYGGRNGANRKTWTSETFIEDEPGTLMTRDSMSVVGDSGGPLYYRNGSVFYLIGIHSTVIRDGNSVTAAAVDLRELRLWVESVQ
jgi:V8-like Glu-specific endopeptidase